MNRRILFLVAALLVALVWFLWPRHVDEGESVAVQRPSSAALSTSAPRASSPVAQLPSPVSESSHLADALNSPGATLHADLQILQDCLGTFRSNFPRDGNPVGTNTEITAALTGKNKLRLALIPPNHPAINRDGELCDRWGTPFFFHAESGARMTVRSAGPDKKFHTPDDEELSP